MESDKTPEVPQKSPGRVVSAWRVLRGQEIVPHAIRAEWVVWQIEFTNLLDKVSQAAARAYERDKVKLRAAEKRIAFLESGAAERPNELLVPTGFRAGSWNPEKSALNRLALSKRGLAVPNFLNNGESDVVSDQSQ